MPAPRDLTPADTSASVAPGLAAALRERWPDVDEVVDLAPARPTTRSPASCARAAGAAAVVVGTIAASADPAQARLVEALLAAGRPVVTVALRTPWDLAAYPRRGHARRRVRDPAADAAAPSLRALFGAIPFRGRAARRGYRLPA